jgi:transposase-like protein
VAVHHLLLACGVNGYGHREFLGADIAISEGGAGSLSFLRSLVIRGLTLSATRSPTLTRSCFGDRCDALRIHVVRSSVRTVTRRVQLKRLVEHRHRRRVPGDSSGNVTGGFGPQLP